MTPRRSLAAGLVPALVALGGLAARPAPAVPAALTSGDQIPGTVWQVIFPAPITLMFDPAVTTNSTAGTLIETTNRANADPLTILFQQMFEAPTSAVSGGLRLSFQDAVTNAAGPAWVGYTLQLIDDTVVPGKANASHPPEPHFHPTSTIAPTAANFTFGAAFTGDDTAKYSGSFLGVSQPDPSDVLQLGGGGNQVGKGQKVQISSLLIHERQFAIGIVPDPGRRVFRLVETPQVAAVPEPSAFALLGLGLLPVGLTARKRRRARTGA